MSDDAVERHHEPQFVVTEPNNVYQSMQGNYFMGQSRLMMFGDGTHSWGGLLNPLESGVNLFVNVFTVSNYSAYPFVAQIWLNATMLGPFTMSNKVTAANLALQPPPRPKARINFAEMVNERPAEGVNPFNRIIPAKTTIADEKNGEIILPPGGSMIIYLVPPGACLARARVAFGWWEESIC